MDLNRGPWRYVYHPASGIESVLAMRRDRSGRLMSLQSFAMKRYESVQSYIVCEFSIAGSTLLWYIKVLSWRRHAHCHIRSAYALTRNPECEPDPQHAGDSLQNTPCKSISIS